MSTNAVHYETLTGFTPLSTLGPYRAADYWKLPEGEPVELIQGRFVVSPAPTTLHQTIVGLLYSLLFEAARRGGGRAVLGPADVVLDDHTILQPDLLYVRRENRGTIQERILGAPDLVIEVLSPHNSRRDRVDKLALYAQFGVAEYWIVDPQERQFDFLLNRGGKFEVQPQQDNRYQSQSCGDLQIDLSSFWHSVDEELEAT